MRDMEMVQLMQMRQLFGGGSTWAEAICLTGLFVLVIFRRESIVSWRLFRFAYLLIAVAILAPPLIIAGFQLEPGMLTQTGSSPNYVSRLVFSIALSCVGPLCLAAAVVCAFGSVLPRDTFSGPPRIVPQKHPLD